MKRTEIMNNFMINQWITSLKKKKNTIKMQSMDKIQMHNG